MAASRLANWPEYPCGRDVQTMAASAAASDQKIVDKVGYFVRDGILDVTRYFVQAIENEEPARAGKCSSQSACFGWFPLLHSPSVR